MSAAQQLPQHFKPGQSGNPGGKKKLTAELRMIRALSHDEVNRIISKFARMEPSRFPGLLEFSFTTAIEAAVIKIFMKCIEHGDHQKLSFLLDRAIGSVRQVTLEEQDEDSRQELENLSTQELLKLVQKKYELLPQGNQPGTASQSDGSPDGSDAPRQIGPSEV